MEYYIVGFIAIIFLYKIFEERGLGWGYIFSIALFIVFGFINNKIEPMLNQDIVSLLCEVGLILLILFIYIKLMYVLFNMINVAAIFVVVSFLVSLVIQYGISIIYVNILEFITNLISSFI